MTITHTRFNFFLVHLFTGIFFCTVSLSQTGESIFRKVVISAEEKKITDVSPSFDIKGLSFQDQDSNRQIENNERGILMFYIMNTGLIETNDFNISINDLNKTGGLDYNNSFEIRSVRTGDSALVEIPVQASDSLTDGSTLFSISVSDSKQTMIKTAEISIPVKDLYSIPVFTWITPNVELERTDYPVYEITGQVRSRSRLTGLKVYINGMLPEDKMTFTVIPAGNPEEYLIKRNLSLQAGYNEVRIEVENSKGKVMSEARVINYNVRKIDQSYREKRLALIIGNSNYITGNILKNPVNDAEAMSSVLKGLGFDVLNYLDTDQKAMKKAMDEFGHKLHNYNVGLFYFAGHGLQVNGINYLIPVDASLQIAQDVDYDCIDVGRLLGKMEEAGTATNIIILDACRDNPFERTWRGRSGGKGSGLAFMNAPSGSIIAYATSPGNTASDGTGKNSIYTEALLQYINIPGQPIEEFFKNVRAAVERKSNKTQTPWESTSLKGSFFFRMK